MPRSAEKYDVGGLLLDRPFKIRRLGHFGFDNVKMAESVRFYSDLLGFRVSDVLDFRRAEPKPGAFDGLGETRGYFMRHGNEHHSMVLFPRRVRQAMARGAGNPEVTTNQITFQVGSLAEVVEGHHWLVATKGVEMERAGRDMLGSNYHSYLYDPDGHVIELFYGVQQIGWDGRSKPAFKTYRRMPEVSPLPQPAEYDEVATEEATGTDLASGYRGTDAPPAKYEVGGILLPRPFKIVRIGPVRLFVKDVAASLAYFRDLMGFIASEEVVFEGHRCALLRVNTEHHSLALYPLALRARLGLSAHSTCASFGLQLGSYRQLRDAIPFLNANGVETFELPPELRPGIDYAFYVRDPDGHALELYYYMEQVGWDGRVRRPDERRPMRLGVWPEALEPMGDAYMGEPFLGPLG
jgi:catechol 2,3-dioxygenase-like lactoylglutathione lyase family enzyme